jgi:hypothetical protein
MSCRFTGALLAIALVTIALPARGMAQEQSENEALPDLFDRQASRFSASLSRLEWSETN